MHIDPHAAESGTTPVPYVRWLDTLTNRDVPIAGGKNASLGEMIRELSGERIHVPDGSPAPPLPPARTTCLPAQRQSL